MTNITAFEQAAKSPSVARSQATAVEQSRAVAEVQAAVVVAQKRPRDVHRAMAEMRTVCGIPALAERAFFRYSRGGGQITGPSVHLARELARCWGNIDYGVKELDRDDDRGHSEMLAFAWDLETNARSEVTFIVPHFRDVKGGPKRLTEMRDIYENNANNAARRLRETIFSVLPVWFTEEAKEICAHTIEHGGGKPLVQQVADCIAAFEGIGIGRAQLERKVGMVSAQWVGQDVATLRVVFTSIKRGEIDRDEEFPRQTVEQQAPKVAADASAFQRAAAGLAPEDQGQRQGGNESASAPPQMDAATTIPTESPALATLRGHLTALTDQGAYYAWYQSAGTKALIAQLPKAEVAAWSAAMNERFKALPAVLDAGDQQSLV